ncbi:MAG: hypothetical protein P8Q90_06975, partial [Candidatus Thalassarchaeaceae archaeon]|nr:hypothetical protein [Candidatus Thalassarchaeaceae archaeon]
MGIERFPSAKKDLRRAILHKDRGFAVRIRLVLTETGEDYLAPACGNACIVHVLPSLSTLQLPLIHRDGSNVLITPQLV